MPNIATLLKSEISRLSRREIRRELQIVKKSSAAYRRDIAALKRKVGALERTQSFLKKRAVVPADGGESATSDRQVRFVPKGLRSMRSRLGLSAAQLALVLGVSEQSVYNWETRKATPRKAQLDAIIALRGLGKREAQARLEAVKPRRRSAKRK